MGEKRPKRFTDGFALGYTDGFRDGFLAGVAEGRQITMSYLRGDDLLLDDERLEMEELGAMLAAHRANAEPDDDDEEFWAPEDEAADEEEDAADDEDEEEASEGV